MSKWILAVLLGMTTCAGSQANSLVLCDFESEAETARFSRRAIGQGSFTRTPDHKAHGQHAARVVFAKWHEGAEEWPALILHMKDDLPSDWSQYDRLVIQVHNESKHNADIAFHIRDTESQTNGQHFTIPAARTETLIYPLHLASNVNMTRIQEMHIFSTRPPEETSVVLDYLRLEEDIAPRLAALDQQIAEWKRQCRSLDLPVLEELDEAARELRERMLLGKEARSTLRAELSSLENRARHQAPRAIAEAGMRADFRKIDSRLPYACGFTTSMVKVFPRDIPFEARVARQGSVELAGNEVEALQLLILAGDQGLQDVEISVSALKRSDRKPARRRPSVTVSPMGFVQTKKPPYHVDYVGWHPDPILDFLKSFDVKPGEMQPVWIECRTPAHTLAGDYVGDIAVRPANAPSVKLGLRVKVWGFDVPSERHLRTALSLRGGPIAQVYGGMSRKMWHKYCDFTLDHRLNPDNIYALDTPPMDDILRWSSRRLNAFNVLYVVKPADLQPGAPYPVEKKKEIMAKLDAFIPKLKAYGLYEKAYLYGFDEVRPETFNAMKDIFSTIKAKYPDLLTLTTAYDSTYGEASGISDIDGWVPLTPSYDPARADRVRSKGKQVWWYICIAPKAPYANWLIEYDAIDARSLMGLQTAKYRPDGFLYYALNRWPLSKKPITEGPYTDWPPASFYDNNGDGSIMCGGPDGPLSTIRLENIRDGIEDYEYFWLLEQEVRRLRAIPGPKAYAALKMAEDALRIGDALVKNLQEFSKSPEAVYAKRRQVAEAIVQARRVRAIGVGEHEYE